MDATPVGATLAVVQGSGRGKPSPYGKNPYASVSLRFKKIS